MLFTLPNNVNWGHQWFPLIIKGNPEVALDHFSYFDLRNKLSTFLKSTAKPKSTRTWTR